MCTCVYLSNARILTSFCQRIRVYWFPLRCVALRCTLTYNSHTDTKCLFSFISIVCAELYCAVKPHSNYWKSNRNTEKNRILFLGIVKNKNKSELRKNTIKYKMFWKIHNEWNSCCLFQRYVLLSLRAYLWVNRFQSPLIL